MKKIQILIALMALSFAAWGQAERVKTVETPDSASLVIFDTTGNNVAGTNVQDAIEESNPTYNNHVWISESGGNNATGKLGDPHRAFADPWAAKDSLSEAQISFNIYDHDYNFSGVYANPPVLNHSLLSIDNTVYNFFGNNTINYNFNTSFAPFITDVVTSFGSAYPRQTWFNGDNLTVNIGNSASISFGIYLLNPRSNIFAHINEINWTGPNNRDVGVYLGGSGKIKIDNYAGRGGILMNIISPYDSTGIVDTVTRNVDIYFGNVTELNLVDKFGNIRFQGQSTTDSASYFKVEIENITATNAYGALFNFSRGGSMIDSYMSYKVRNARIQGPINPVNTPYSGGQANNGASNLGFGDAGVHNSTIIIQGDNWQSEKGPFFGNFIGAPTVMDSSTLKIKIKNLTVDTGTIFLLQNFTLRNNSKIIIDCENCMAKGGNVMSLWDITVDATSEIVIRGRYESGMAGQAVINTRVPVTLEGIFLNDGVSAWISSDAPTPLITANGIWSNSNSTLNVEIQGNELFGFNYPKTDAYYDLQTILDSIFISIPKQSATFYQETLRQYAFTSGDTILIDTLTNALITDSITQDTGYIRNISSDTVRWQVSYNFFKDSDEDPLSTFMDLTTDGSDAPEAIPGSRSTTEQTAIAGIPAPGPTFIVDMPPGDAIRLCAYSNASAVGVGVTDLTITVQELYRE